MESSEGRFHALLTRLFSMDEEERYRIAREIHDELGQPMIALKIDLVWLAERLPRKSEALHKKIQTMTNLIDGTIRVVRRIAAELRPTVLDDLGLVAALEWLVGYFQRRTGIVCVLTKNPEEIVVDATRATALFRICQDALTNGARHATTTRIEVKLTQEETGLFMEVQYNGRGILDDALTDPGSLGLMGMRERIVPWGGDVHIRGVRGTGSVVAVRIPTGNGKVALPGGIW